MSCGLPQAPAKLKPMREYEEVERMVTKTGEGGTMRRGMQRRAKPQRQSEEQSFRAAVKEMLVLVMAVKKSEARRPQTRQPRAGRAAATPVWWRAICSCPARNWGKRREV